jgi:hypothetical protein
VEDKYLAGVEIECTRYRSCHDSNNGDPFQLTGSSNVIRFPNASPFRKIFPGGPSDHDFW